LSIAPGENASEARAHFERECEVLASLQHPAICQILDVLVEGDQRYLVMEFIDGVTLASELAVRGKPGLPEAEVLCWAETLVDVLTYLHEYTDELGVRRPIIFRDLKPLNVMLRKEGGIALIDFGIARPMATSGGTAIGTGGYAPPEQYQGQAEPRSDQYALAATLHHLLTGRDPTVARPFDFPAVSDLVPDINPRIDAALARALSMRVADRFPSVSAFGDALLGLQPGPAGPADSLGASSAPGQLPALVEAGVRIARQQSVPVPEGLEVRPLPDGMTIHRRTTVPRVVQGLFCAVWICGLACVMFGSAVGSGSLSPAILLVVVPIVLACAYLCVASSVDSTDIVLTTRDIRMNSGPMPTFGGGGMVRSGDIFKVVVRYGSGQSRTAFKVRYVNRRGQEKTIVSGLSEYQAEYIAQAFEETLTPSQQYLPLIAPPATSTAGQPQTLGNAARGCCTRPPRRGHPRRPRLRLRARRGR
jgi:hypothetical protein